MKSKITVRIATTSVICLSAIGLLNGAEQRLTPAGRATQLRQPPPSADWHLSGNAGTTPGRNFIGTTDNQAMELRVNRQRAFRIEPNTNSPNILGGFSGNQLGRGLAGATISGGGGTYIDYDDTPPDVYPAPQRISADFGTIGGGLGNLVQSYAAVVSGGLFNTIGPGSDFSAISGGHAHLIGTNSIYCTIGGGSGNEVKNDTPFSIIAGGIGNEMAGPFSAIGGGGNNRVFTNATSSVIAGGSGNTAAAPCSTIPGGVQALTLSYGQQSYSSGSFNGELPGHCQASLFVVRRRSHDAAPVELFLDGGVQSGERINVPNGARWCFEAMIIGSNVAGETAGFQIKGVVKNVNGAMSFVGAPSVTPMGTDPTAANWTAIVEADDARDALVFKVAGAPTLTGWVGSVRTSEFNLFTGGLW
jgi:hypothetical protein